ncbi:hypothetical protein SAMN05216268_116215 [Streptomyces yunnanensis]|uniref:Uncharacterized protein n=1 Tax=Streptomyces yunnanensis TaxID=156453 RepID=A0A9X8N4M8_9ACTN|nr:hypothetical protein SAMN05216268_116215 [Streptomyces yunnanensis]
MCPFPHAPRSPHPVRPHSNRQQGVVRSGLRGRGGGRGGGESAVPCPCSFLLPLPPPSPTPTPTPPPPVSSFSCSSSTRARLVCSCAPPPVVRASSARARLHRSCSSAARLHRSCLSAARRRRSQVAPTAGVLLLGVPQIGWCIVLGPGVGRDVDQGRGCAGGRRPPGRDVRTWTSKSPSCVACVRRHGAALSVVVRTVVLVSIRAAGASRTRPASVISHGSGAFPSLLPSWLSLCSLLSLLAFSFMRWRAESPALSRSGSGVARRCEACRVGPEGQMSGAGGQ